MSADLNEDGDWELHMGGGGAHTRMHLILIIHSSREVIAFSATYIGVLCFEYAFISYVKNLDKTFVGNGYMYVSNFSRK